jgi:hypothetical protein
MYEAVPVMPMGDPTEVGEAQLLDVVEALHSHPSVQLPLSLK